MREGRATRVTLPSKSTLAFCSSRPRRAINYGSVLRMRFSDVQRITSNITSSLTFRATSLHRNTLPLRSHASNEYRRMMMLPMRLPRSLCCRSSRQLLIIAVTLFIFFDLSQVLHCRSASATELELPVKRPERIYIASIHWNNEEVLQSHWNNAVVALTKVLGPENVFVSVYESGSWDNSKHVLRELDTYLGQHNIRRNITLSDSKHRDEMSVANEKKGPGWIKTPGGKKELRRIPYLSRLRDWTLKPLQELSRRGEVFDKVLFLNDVVFSVCLED
jgi:hypothetical protein